MITTNAAKNHVQQLIFQEISKMLEDGYNDTQIVNNFQSKGAEVSDIMAIITNVKNNNPMNNSTEILLTNGVQKPKPVNTNPMTSDFFNQALKSATVLDKEVLNNNSVVKTPVIDPKLITAGQPDYRFVLPKVDHPLPIGDTYPTKLNILGRQVEVSLIKRNPEIIVLDNVLTAEECKQFIELAKPKIKPSNVVDRNSGNNVSHDARTSTGAFFGKGETPLLRWIEQFCAEFLNWPYEKSEGFQALNYQVGQQYLAHFDHFDPDTKSGKEISATKAGNRNATILFYLNDVDEGGGTQFPKLDLTVMPKMGRMLYFGYPDILKADHVLHAGMPPTKGEKWVAVNWYRQGNYT